ncbi:hypothetical protein COUCH_15480 [Couchioplanes caeruleus]|uniref:hypothetical protein n=1 Tax=Couchioplanes caeruleus TaxID=56438 RepID=UPI0020C00E95|nr:hypothetical protein [Couchioplanes caeruleus]UQU67582.1 hypothetical protein COUCH_15480 [Couchioplanes caeruleus]
MVILPATLLTTVGCSRQDPGAETEAKSTHPTPVEAACDLNRAAIAWSEISQQPVIASAFTVDGANVTHVAKIDVGPRVDDAALTADAVHVVVQSLARRLKMDIQNVPLSDVQTDISFSNNPGVRIVVYSGADQVSGVFRTDCNPVITGKLTSWTAATRGVVDCSQPKPAGGYDLQAYSYCEGWTELPPASGAPAQDVSTD